MPIVCLSKKVGTDNTNAMPTKSCLQDDRSTAELGEQIEKMKNEMSGINHAD